MPSAVVAEDTLLDRFDYNGDIRARGIYLARDLDLPSAPIEDGERRQEESYYEYYECQRRPETCQRTPRHEELDYYTMRFRLNLAFRPSPYADVLYGVEVGDMIFGREGGGQGSGATNVETRRVLLKLHNSNDTASGSVGVFSVSSPNGLVLATSGGGARLIYESVDLLSSFEGVYLRAVDNSHIDGDSNGFSDENFADLDLGMLRWRWSGVSGLKTDLYGVYRADEDPSVDDITDSNQETSRLYWGGLFVTYRFKAFEVMLHGVGLSGRFHRPLADDPDFSTERIGSDDPLRASGYLDELLAPPLRKEYRVNAGAGQAELSYQILDSLKLSLRAAGGSGRLPDDIEPDGTSVDYRADQFRSAAPGFQYTDIAIDSSGGYSIFSGGELTGVLAQGAAIRYQIAAAWSAELAYYNIEAFRTPILTENQNYTSEFRQESPTNYLGSEWNLSVAHSFSSDLNFELRAAFFDAGSGYKAWRDIEYGDDLFESQFYITQSF